MEHKSPLSGGAEGPPATEWFAKNKYTLRNKYTCAHIHEDIYANTHTNIYSPIHAHTHASTLTHRHMNPLILTDT